MVSEREQLLERFLIDARGFIQWAFDNKQDPSGLANRDCCFSPRVTNYAKFTE